MTIMQSECRRAEKGCRNFHENFDLNVTAQELEQQPDLQGTLLENHSSQYSELSGKMEKHGDNLCMEAQIHEEQVPQLKTFEGCVDDHLLILAQSAEIVAAQSEDGVASTHTNNQNKDQECSQEPAVSHVSSERLGLCYRVTRTRLTQIRKQARVKYLILDQERAEDKQCKHSQGKTIRLSQIKHQARCKSKNDFSPQMITGPRNETIRLSQIKRQARCKSKNDFSPQMVIGPRNEQPRGRILRLSQMRHQARSKNKSTAKEGTEEHMGVSQHCNRFRDSNLSMVEGVTAHDIFRGARQLSVVRWDDENHKERQRVARRLRAFKTEKLRQRFRAERIRNSADARLDAMKMSSIGSSSTTNSQWLSNSATLLKDKDLITCQRELPETFGCTERKANFGTEKLQGHHGSNESSGLRCKYLQHIPNGLPVQNSILLFTGLPNYIFQQYDAYMGWMLYMHHMQLKEYHRVVALARQHRAERIEEKRALKYKQQNSKNPALANSVERKEFLPVKRLRPTQLRREVRIGNQCSIMQGPDEN